MSVHSATDFLIKLQLGLQPQLGLGLRLWAMHFRHVRVSGRVHMQHD